MFTEIAVTRHITEHYTDFTEEILTEQKPVTNWPQQLATKCVPFIQERVVGKDGEAGGGLKVNM